MRKYLPGYTGHIPEEIPQTEGVGQSEVRSHIPGYQGYIPGVQSENVYGETYGKVTYKAAEHLIPKGTDLGPRGQYQTTHSSQFVNLNSVKEKTASEILGIPSRAVNSVTVIPVATSNLFWGVHDNEQAFKQATATFFGEHSDPADPQTPSNSLAENTAQFFGREQREKPIKLGGPVPGYTGVSRRVVADNIFGVTYGNSRRVAHTDMRTSKQEHSETLQQRAVFTPDYRR